MAINPAYLPMPVNAMLSVDFSTLSDGALPAAFAGSTWAIASGRAVNAVTLGAELLTDPGLEASYTDGLCATLTKVGSPTVAESADAHGGTKAQQFTGAAANNQLRFGAVAGVARQWRQFSMWGKVTAGSAGNARFRMFITNGLPVNTLEAAITGASYTQKKISMLCTDTNSMFTYAAHENGSSGFATVISDDASLKAITASSLFAIAQSTFANAVVKVKPVTPLADDTQVGIVARADAQTNPTHFILLIIQRHPTVTTAATAYLIKKVSNTYTSVTSGSITLASGAFLELRMNGSTAQIFYNNAQVGTDQTISDSELVSNTYHGMFSAGDNLLQSFLVSGN